jgi:hypothetical protein
VIDATAVTAFGAGFGFALFVWVMAWGTLVLVKFFKDLLSGVTP